MKVNAFLTSFDKVIYVDSKNGSDNTGDGSENQPLSTIATAKSKVTSNNTAIVLKSGNYTITTLMSLFTSYSLTYIAESFFDKEKIVNVTITNTTTSNFTMTELNTVIGVVFKRNSGGDDRVWEYVYDGSTLNIDFYNCVFTKGTIQPSSGLMYTGNSSGCTIKNLNYIYCSFPFPVGAITGTGVSKGVATDCATTNSTFLKTYENQNLSNAVFDENYNIINSNKEYGVYFGNYAWGKKIERILFLSDGNKIASVNASKTLSSAIPKMTSNTTPNGVASASSIYSTGYNAWNAFDENENTLWATPSGVSSGWISYKFDAPKVIDKYSMAQAKAYTVTTMPKNFSFEGSNDGSSWVILDKQENITWLNNEEKEFSFKNSKPFLYYRINVAVNGSGTEYIVIKSIKMFEKTFGKVTYLPSYSIENFSQYGSVSIKYFNSIFENVHYVLQDTVSEDVDGLWKTKLDRKPLSISFD